MERNDQREQQLWELVYDLLPEEEAAELRERICSDPQLARLYADVRLKSELVAQATRIEGPAATLRHPERVARVAAGQPPARRSGSWPAHRIREVAPWLITSAAAVLMWFTGFTYLKPDSPVRGNLAERIRTQLRDEPARTTVVGSGMLPRDREGYLALVTRTQAGRPAAARVRVRWLADDRRLLDESEVATDAAGLAQIRTPAFSAESRVRLEVVARGSRATSQATAALDVRDQPLSTHVATDRPVYRPGEVIRYRSVTLSRFDLAVAGEVEIDYRLVDPAGVAVARTTEPQRTRFGVGSGELRVPVTAAEGAYQVVASSPQGRFDATHCRVSVLRFQQPEVYLAVDFDRDSYLRGQAVTGNLSVRNPRGEAYAGARLEMTVESEGQEILDRKSVRADEKGRARFEMMLPAAGEPLWLRARLREEVEQSLVREIPVRAGEAAVDFFPESGALVAGVPNRVYFFARDEAGEAVSVSGQVVDPQGREVADVATRRDGRGVIEFVPADRTPYRLRIPGESGVEEIALPEASRWQFAVLRAESAVVAADDPLAVTVHSLRPECPVAVTAACRGTVVGQTLIGPDQFQRGPTDPSGTARVTVPLEDDADGVIRLTAYDYSRIPPVPLAERLVFRRPSRQLAIRIQAAPQPWRAAGEGRLRVAVQDERREACPAVLGVSLVDDAVFGLVEDPPVGIAAHFWVNSQLPQAAALEDANIYLEPGSEDLLDLLLGTQGWRRIVALEQPQSAAASAEAAASARWQADTTLVRIQPDGVAPTVIADNPRGAGRALAEAYRQSLHSRQVQMNRSGVFVLVASFVLVTLLVFGKRLLAHRARVAWAVSLLAATACLLVGLGWSTARLDARGELAWGPAESTPRGELREPPPGPAEAGAVESALEEVRTWREPSDVMPVLEQEELEEDAFGDERADGRVQRRRSKAAPEAVPDRATGSPAVMRDEAVVDQLQLPKDAAQPFAKGMLRERKEKQEASGEQGTVEFDVVRGLSESSDRGQSPSELPKLGSAASPGQSLPEAPEEPSRRAGGDGPGGLGGGLGMQNQRETAGEDEGADADDKLTRQQELGKRWNRPGHEPPADDLRSEPDASPLLPPPASRFVRDAESEPEPRPGLKAARASAGRPAPAAAPAAAPAEAPAEAPAAAPAAAPEPASATAPAEAAPRPLERAPQAAAADEEQLDSRAARKGESPRWGLAGTPARSAPNPSAAPRSAGDFARPAAGQPLAEGLSVPDVPAAELRLAEPLPQADAAEQEGRRKSAEYYFREYAPWGTGRGWLASPPGQGTVVWEPLVETGPEGVVELPIRLPDRPGAYRVRVDGHGGGRLGSLTRILPVVDAPPNPAPAPAPPAASSAD